MKMKTPKLEELKEFLKKTKLKEKYVKEIDKNLMNYYLNIECISTKNEKLLKKTKNKKITDFYM